MQARRILWRVVVVLVMAMVVVWLGACASQAEPSEPVMEDTADGAALLEQSCTKCHNLDRVTSKQWSRDQWEQTVDNMIQKGAEVSADNKEPLLDYLSETYGP